MTVIGISGCSALLVAGFGIQDSIGEIVVLQYEELNKYDVSMTFSTDATASQRDKALDELKANKDISDAMGVAIYHGFYADEGEDKGVDIYVPADVNEYQKFTVLRTRKGPGRNHCAPRTATSCGKNGVPPIFSSERR